MVECTMVEYTADVVHFLRGWRGSPFYLMSLYRGVRDGWIEEFYYIFVCSRKFRWWKWLEMAGGERGRNGFLVKWKGWIRVLSTRNDHHGKRLSVMASQNGRICWLEICIGVFQAGFDFGAHMIRFWKWHFAVRKSVEVSRSLKENLIGDAFHVL